MKCPKCHEELVLGKEREYETLCEHVCDPNQESYPLRPTYVCKNDSCPVSKEDVFWDETGDFYGWSRNFEFDNEISSAYPSFSRKLDIEIYKKGLKSKVRLHPCLMLWFLQPMIEFTYKADEYGNVLKRGYKLIWLKKDSWKPWVKDEWGYHTHYSFPIMILMRHVRNHIYTIINCSETYRHNEAKRLLEPLASWDKRWWRKVEKWLDRNIFYRYYIK